MSSVQKTERKFFGLQKWNHGAGKLFQTFKGNDSRRSDITPRWTYKVNIALRLRRKDLVIVQFIACGMIRVSKEILSAIKACGG